MKDLEKKLRMKVQKMSDSHLNWCLAAFGILALFAIFDIETLKKIEVWDISGIANTVDTFASPILGIFENTFIKALIYASFSITLLLRAYKSAIHPRAIIINHSSFSNAQSSYDPCIVSGYSVKEKDINLVDQLAHHNVVDAIRVQDSLIEEVLNNCDKSTELFYYGIAHIPLIFRAGFQLGDEGKVRLLHKYRNEQSLFKEISSAPDDQRIQLRGKEQHPDNTSKEMLVVIATSFPVSNDDLAVFRGNTIGHELIFGMEDKSMYGFDVVDSYAVMNRLRIGILGKIREIVANKRIERIHMVLATSSDFTFFLSQGFSKYHDPEIIVYQYERSNPSKYPWGISNKSSPASSVFRTNNT